MKYQGIPGESEDIFRRLLKKKGHHVRRFVCEGHKNTTKKSIFPPTHPLIDFNEEVRMIHFRTPFGPGFLVPGGHRRSFRHVFFVF